MAGLLGADKPENPSDFYLSRCATRQEYLNLLAYFFVAPRRKSEIPVDCGMKA
jgi:hypothetical protein